MPSNDKCSQLAIFSLEKLGFEDGQTNSSLVFYKSRLSLPMDLLAADFKEGLAPEEAGDMLQVKGLARFRAGCHLDPSYLILGRAMNRSSNDWAAGPSLVNGKVKVFIGLAIVFDFQCTISKLLEVVRDTPVGTSVQ